MHFYFGVFVFFAHSIIGSGFIQTSNFNLMTGILNVKFTEPEIKRM